MMEKIISGATLSLVKCDITHEIVDAIGNAANSALAGGGGVDGAIHNAGGVKIKEACKKIGGCPTGSAVITEAGDLKAKFVIHGVGPKYSGGHHGEAEKLRSVYNKMLELAATHDCVTLALPSISTGAYGYPVNDASLIALETGKDFLKNVLKRKHLKLVKFCLFSDHDLKVYSESLKKIGA